MLRYVMQTLKYQEIALRLLRFHYYFLKYIQNYRISSEHPVIIQKYTSLPCCNTYKIVHSLYYSEQINQQAKVYESVKNLALIINTYFSSQENVVVVSVV